MKVKATKLGYYNYSLRRPGVVFNIKEDSHFSSKWMVKADRKEKAVKEAPETIIQEDDEEEDSEVEPI